MLFYLFVLHASCVLYWSHVYLFPGQFDIMMAFCGALLLSVLSLAIAVTR